MRRPAVLFCLLASAAHLRAASETPPQVPESGVIPRAQPVTIPVAVPVDPKNQLAPSPDLNVPGQKRVPEEMQKISKRAIAAMAKGDLDSARRDFLKVLEAAPDNVPTIINLGLVEYRSKHLEEAEKRLQGAVRLAPDGSLAWLILGIVQYDRSRYDNALASLAQAAVLEPKNAMVHHYLGVTIGQKGWYSGAEDEMRKAIQIDPSYAEAHFNLAVFYLQRNPPAVELARRHYERALELGAAPDPDVEKSLTPPKP
ncbi:MAG: tetratricopeptide repeat protein [Chthoniobacter sp.]|nr:tetratricopeptide repeat protein [Chthoniobacter sp.]